MLKAGNAYHKYKAKRNSWPKVRRPGAGRAVGAPEHSARSRLSMPADGLPGVRLRRFLPCARRSTVKAFFTDLVLGRTAPRRRRRCIRTCAARAAHACRSALTSGAPAPGARRGHEPGGAPARRRQPPAHRARVDRAPRRAARPEGRPHRRAPHRPPQGHVQGAGEGGEVARRRVGIGFGATRTRASAPACAAAHSRVCAAAHAAASAARTCAAAGERARRQSWGCIMLFGVWGLWARSACAWTHAMRLPFGAGGVPGRFWAGRHQCMQGV